MRKLSKAHIILLFLVIASFGSYIMLFNRNIQYNQVIHQISDDIENSNTQLTKGIINMIKFYDYGGKERNTKYIEFLESGHSLESLELIYNKIDEENFYQNNQRLFNQKSQSSSRAVNQLIDKKIESQLLIDIRGRCYPYSASMILDRFHIYKSVFDSVYFCTDLAHWNRMDIEINDLHFGVKDDLFEVTMSTTDTININWLLTSISFYDLDQQIDSSFYKRTIYWDGSNWRTL